MASGTAQVNPKASMDKKTPEYSMNQSELVYPGEGDAFASHPPTSGTHRRPVSHSASPLTGHPRNKIHLEPNAVKTFMEELKRCIAACEACADMKTSGTEPEKYAKCVMLSRACADICTLLHGYLASAETEEFAHMAVDLAPVCARVCEACALECGRHPDMASCVACANACSSCAKQCRRSAQS